MPLRPPPFRGTLIRETAFREMLIQNRSNPWCPPQDSSDPAVPAVAMRRTDRILGPIASWDTGIMNPPEPDKPRITLIGRSGCHLCDVAREVVSTVARDAAAGWVEVDVDADPELQRRYGEQVPVVLVDGAQHDFWRVDPVRLRLALAGRPSDRSGGESGRSG